MQAIQVWNFLANGTGGIDLQGLDAALVMFDPPPEQLELLLWRLEQIKRYRPPAPQGPAAT